MLEQFEENLQSTGLVPHGARVLVGYSGGADSTCLLHLLKKCGIDVVAGHLHHGQRAEADDELAQCAKLAEQLEIPFVSGKADIPEISRQSKISLEEAGREARYAFFESARQQLNCHRIATGHTMDDQIETVIFNLVRGTGLTGLQGIPQQRDFIIRPLLRFKRAETREYCQRENLWFHDDPANFELKNSRTRIRLNVVPELVAINPAAYEAINRLGELVREEEELLNGLAARNLEQTEVALNGQHRPLTLDCEVAFDQKTLLNAPKVVVIRGMRLAAQALGAHMDYGQSVGLYQGLMSEKGSWTLDEGNVVIEWCDNTVHFRQLSVTSVSRYPLTTPGETESLEFGWTIESERANPGEYLRPRHSLDVVINPQQLKGNLYLQSALPEDRIQPLGMTGNRLLTDVFQEMGLSEAARKRLPVVYDMVGPVWVPGACLAERVKMTNNTEHGLRLNLNYRQP